ncbi:AAA family ATPase [Quadrisphaera setariae]|uniref:AAA family ATPase n=1 Tax=Quadrisphaera setariae TaxID=2593304 RepID=A0A5C8ZJB6_9ACTN|nr:AAA family ATPase [Quadrisphaera setariae]
MGGGSAGTLVVLRGNSGSGKTTVARAVQRRFPKGTCAVVSQDRIRREVLRAAAPSVAACSRAPGPDRHRPAGGDALP